MLQGEHSQVTLEQPLCHVVSWLANEKAPPPSTVDLAREFFSCRAPSRAQQRIAEALLNGFLLGHREWELWEFVGRATRTAQDQSRLESWRKQLATRLRAVTSFHEQLRAAFLRDVNAGDVRYAHREIVDKTVQLLLDRVSALLALGIAEVASGAVVGRFECAVLVESKLKLADKRASIARPLSAAFAGGTFQLEFRA